MAQSYFKRFLNRWVCRKFDMGVIQEIIKDKERALKSYSRGLESKIHLLNKSWTVVDGDSKF